MNILSFRNRIALATVCLAIFLPGTLSAKLRSQQQMLQAAQQALYSGGNASTKAKVKGNAVKRLVAADSYTVYGTTTGGFAVIANDDLIPAVLGYSDQSYDNSQKNTNFKWWLDAVDEAVKAKVKAGKAIERTTKPDTSKYPEAVAPLLTTTWGQDAPYNNLCPIATDGTGRCLTGCAATSTAQVLYYHKGPKNGMGTKTIYYPYGQTSGIAISVNFENEVYDWNNMIDNYSGSYTSAEGDAVAMLMRDIAVAADMEYGSDAQGGSGALHSTLATGLQRYFGLEDVKYLEREDYTEQAWMNIIYDQLKNNLPLVYGGFTKSKEGHSFVFDGYDKDGLVHVNWGWDGSHNGYYDVAILDPPAGYVFSEMQEMVININPESAISLIDGEVTVNQPGTLSSHIDADNFFNYKSLKVNGTINATDVRTLREMSGVDENGNRTHGQLATLDLSNASIAAGDDYYIIDKNKKLTITADNTLPDKMFYGCKLQEINFPSTGIKSFGTGVWAYCNKLATVKLTSTDDADFMIDGDVVYDKDKQKVIAAVPLHRDDITVPAGVTTIGDYAFAGCSMVRNLTLGDDVKSIGKEAFGYCWSLEQLKVRSKDVPQLTGADVFSGASTESCKLTVRAGMKTRFSSLAQWKDFTNIVEFGTTVKVRNASREYGEENPELKFTISGDKVAGTPVLACEATKTSGVGRYKITISRGTIEGEDVELQDGYLVIKQAPLEVIAEDKSREVGKENPDFTLRYKGFKNDETESVLNEKPTISCVADKDSEAGIYDIIVEGGDADNYELSYTNGKLTVTTASAIEKVSEDGTIHPFDIYSISGQLIKSKATGFAGLPSGVYVVKGKKVVIFGEPAL